MYRIQTCAYVPLCTLSRTFVPTYAPALQRGVSCRVGIILALSRVPHEQIDFAAALVRVHERKPHRVRVRIEQAAVVWLSAVQAELLHEHCMFLAALRNEYERHGRIVVPALPELPLDSEHSKQQFFHDLVGNGFREQCLFQFRHRCCLYHLLSPSPIGAKYIMPSPESLYMNTDFSHAPSGVSIRSVNSG